MGACTSCGVAAAVERVAGTAKVVLTDGGLREYARPVTAGRVLGKEAARFFVCDADEMEFDRHVSALGTREELRPGQIYFVLPRSALNYPVHAEDLAALAMRASAALVDAGGRCGRRAVAPLVFPEGEGDAGEAVAGERTAEEKRQVGRKCGGRPRKFSSELCAIEE